MTDGYSVSQRVVRSRASFATLLLVAVAGAIAGFAAIFSNGADAAPLTPEQRAELSRSNAQMGRRGPAPLLASTSAYNWSGLYGGAFTGGVSGGGKNLDISAPTNPVAQGNGVGFGAQNASGYPIFSQAYNNGANGNGLPGSVTPTAQDYRCNTAGSGPGTNCFPGNAPNGPFGPQTASTTNVPYFIPGTRTDATFPTSLAMQQKVAALIGAEIGYRLQFNSPLVLGIGTDITIFGPQSGEATSNSTGAFFNRRGANATANATACTAGSINVGGGQGGNNIVNCDTTTAISAAGSYNVDNFGNSAASLTGNTSMNWLGTVRGSMGYAFDRLLIFGSAGLAYGDASVAIRGTYRDTVTSSCTGINQTVAPGVVNVAGGNNTVGTGGLQGSAAVNYNCNGVANGPATRTTIDTVNYLGSRSGVMAGFAVGGGVGYAVTDNIILKTEGFYYNLGTVRTTVTGSGTSTTTTSAGTGAGTQTAALTATPFTVSRVVDGYIAKAGVEVKFSAF